MMKDFQNLAEFQALCDDQLLDLAAVEAILARLCTKRLTGVLTDLIPVRKIRIRQWIRELQKITGRPVLLQLTREETTPYMHEDGVICFCKKDVYRADKLFMLLAHETAHFVLMQDARYALIKQIDADYCSCTQQKSSMHSPIERCANLITLVILTRCMRVERNQKRLHRIEICIESLRKQLTNQAL